MISDYCRASVAVGNCLLNSLKKGVSGAVGTILNRKTLTIKTGATLVSLKRSFLSELVNQKDENAPFTTPHLTSLKNPTWLT